MPNYLCVQRNLSSGEGEQPSPAQMQEMYAKFGAWQEQFSSNLVDMGGRLGAGKLITDGEQTEARQIDGPFVELKELVGGYMIVSAANLNEAGEVARQCPGLVRPGSGVEVVEIHTG